jgi:DNA-directed RNA polymerase subunit RPC12/RpoP
VGISISIFEGEIPRFPFEIKVTLKCDDGSQLFCRDSATLQSSEGFIGCHRMFMSMGWLERNTSAGRLWLCPTCSMKVLTKADGSTKFRHYRNGKPATGDDDHALD